MKLPSLSRALSLSLSSRGANTNEQCHYCEYSAATSYIKSINTPFEEMISLAIYHNNVFRIDSVLVYENGLSLMQRFRKYTKTLDVYRMCKSLLHSSPSNVLNVGCFHSNLLLKSAILSVMPMRVEANKKHCTKWNKIQREQSKMWINSIYNAFGIVNNIKMQKVSWKWILLLIL